MSAPRTPALLTTLALVLGLAAGARAADGDGGRQDSSAEVLYLAGGVSATHADGAAVEVAVGTRLVAGDTLVTAADGLASLRLIGHEESLEHDHMLVSSGTTVVIADVFVDAERKQRNVVLKLLDGLVEIVTAHSGEGRTAIDVETPTAIGGVRGTEFRVAVEPAADAAPVATRVETLDGAVELQGQGEVLAVTGGHGSRVREGEAPGPLHPLPPAPVLADPPDGARPAAFAFRWEPVDGAAGYVVEIAEDAAFHRLAHRAAVDGPEYAPAQVRLPLREAGYHWRVSAVDADGFQGRPSPGRALLQAAP